MPRSFTARSAKQFFLSDHAGVYPPFGGCAISANMRLLNQGREPTVTKPMTYFQAKQIIDNQLYIDAVLEYRRDPIGVSDKTYRRAYMWIQAEGILSSKA